MMFHVYEEVKKNNFSMLWELQYYVEYIQSMSMTQLDSLKKNVQDYQGCIVHH